MMVGRIFHSLASGSLHFKLSFSLTIHILPELGTIRQDHMVKQMTFGLPDHDPGLVVRVDGRNVPGRLSYMGTVNKLSSIWR